MDNSTIGSRIRSRRRELKLTQREVAQYIGISSSAVTQWERDMTVPGGQSLVFLSEVLDCSPDWIMNGKDVPGDVVRVQFPASPEYIREIPVISWVQAGQWTDPCFDDIRSTLTVKDADDTVFTTTKVSDGAFGLKVKGDSMTTTGGALSIPAGSTVIVDPEFGSIDNLVGRIVIVQLGGSGEATIKKLAKDGPIYYLLPLNPAFRAIEVDQDCKVIGEVKQVIINF